jgi:hypothetical protein
MKRILLTVLFCWLPVSVFAAGTCTVGQPKRAELVNYPSTLVQIKVECTGDSSDGSFPEVIIDGVGGHLMSVYFDPGSTTPTTAMDMTVELTNLVEGSPVTTDIDLLGGAGANIDTSADALITPLVGAVSVPVGFYGDLNVTLTGNSVNSATLTYYLIFVP